MSKFVSTHPERHYYLYAKNWYKRTDLRKDLAKILCNYTGWEYLGNEEEFMAAIRKLIYLWEHHYLAGHMGSNVLFELFDDLNPNGLRFGFKNKDYDYYEVLAQKLLSGLCYVDIKDIGFDIGKPDNSLLPLYSGSIR